MEKKKLPIRKFCFAEVDGKRKSKGFTLKAIILETDVTDQDVENICILPIGESVSLTPEDEWCVRRLK